jgi:hypothetical protein
MTYRELASYVQGLSPQSRTRTALNDGLVEPSPETVVLADVFDAITIHDWHFAAVNTDDKKPSPKRPKPYPRWWTAGTAKTKPAQSSQRVARIEDARRRRRERAQAIAEGRIS